jgi:hypothetical protein
LVENNPDSKDLEIHLPENPFLVLWDSDIDVMMKILILQFIQFFIQIFFCLKKEEWSLSVINDVLKILFIKWKALRFFRFTSLSPFQKNIIFLYLNLWTFKVNFCNLEDENEISGLILHDVFRNRAPFLNQYCHIFCYLFPRCIKKPFYSSKVQKVR